MSTQIWHRCIFMDFRKQGKEFLDTDRLITFRDFHFSTKYKLHSNYQLNCFESPLNLKLEIV